MRLVFLGSGEFAVPALEHLGRRGLAPLLVFTQPDRPAGRGRRPAPPPVKAVAVGLGLAVRQPEAIGAPEPLAELRAAAADFLVVAAYGQILPPEVLSVPRLACVNLHASLLPRWRGAAPVARAILAGDSVTGVTTIRMDAGVDTGDILLQEEVPILPRETAGDLAARLAGRGAPLVEATLRGLAAGTLACRPQPGKGATRARRLQMDEARLDWRLAADDLDRRVRGYSPWPVAWTTLRGERLKVWRACPAEDARAGGGAAAGAVARAEADTLRVACGSGALDLIEIQFAGGRRLTAREAINGGKIHAGDTFDP
jgi:methionyl-tRNA formyltransferase